MSARDLFVARFGEADAARLEAAADEHLAQGWGEHAEDSRGSDPFRYVLLTCIAFECVGRYASAHGIEAHEDDMREWALKEADLAHHDGDVPDYLALMAGMYVPWVDMAAVQEEVEGA